MTTFITAHELSEAINNGKSPTILAVLGKLDVDGNALYQAGHIPTAQYCSPIDALAGVPDTGTGRNPLPDEAIFAREAHKWGLRKNRPVVVYDAGEGVSAARAWWILRWAGVSNVRILDGGHAEWRKQGFQLVGGPGNISVETNVEISVGQMPVATIDDVKAHVGRGGKLVDARQDARFAGRHEILDLKAGHIPGAVNVPVDQLVTEDNTIRDAGEIAERFAAAGVTSGEDVIVYSGSGNHSAYALAAMEYAGLTGAANYIGGWSQWSFNPENPVER